MTFKRGDIVRLVTDEREAEHCHSASIAEGLRARRYVVVDEIVRGFVFRMPDGTHVGTGACRRFTVWGATWTSRAETQEVREVDMIPTGETAEEVGRGW